MLAASRRAIFKGLLALPFIAAPVAAAPVIRAPFLLKGEYVDSIISHLWGERPRPPVGALLVHEILPWDGTGYPIVLARCGWRYEDRQLFDGFYDHEWANLRREVPDRFWHSAANRRRYPNIHSYVREQRFGEHPRVMRRLMARNARLGPDAFPDFADVQPRMLA